MYYDLWDLESGNQLETFATERQALAAVRGYLKAAPEVYENVLSLGYVDDDGKHGIVAEGAVLAIKAKQAAQDVKRVSGGMRKKRNA
jgi:hypothetical protein